MDGPRFQCFGSQRSRVEYAAWCKDSSTFASPLKVRRLRSSTSVHDLGRSLNRLALPHALEQSYDVDMGEVSVFRHPPFSHPAANSLTAAAVEIMRADDGEAPSGAEPSTGIAGALSEDEEADREPGLSADIEGLDAGPGPSASISGEDLSEFEKACEEPGMDFWHGSGVAGAMLSEEMAAAAASPAFSDRGAPRCDGGAHAPCFPGSPAAAGASSEHSPPRKRNASHAHEAARAAWVAAAGARATAREIVARRAAGAGDVGMADGDDSCDVAGSSREGGARPWREAESSEGPAGGCMEDE